ncbi:MAG: molybdenum cofactor guanylyltransferase [Desulfobacterales bacterium]|nr:molybdenum cofactor guanylyltransferase [Desulfobacterales bacterium]MDJ0913213.1 molybdenum cofactor guanylyltransferase [Desulfobacterales bacterium]
MTYPFTGVILAGGESKRFAGENKALLKIGGQTIFERILLVFSELFDDIILVTNTPHHYIDWDIQAVTDLFAVRSSLTGIHAGLFYANTTHAFCVACDTPFVQKALIRCILDAIEPQMDVIVPKTSKGLEALFGAYSKRCIKPIARKLQNNQLKIQGFFSEVRTRKIPEETLRQHDAELISFFNINTPDDLQTAERIHRSIA